MIRRSGSSHLAPAVSLNSFVLGFLIGSVVFYALHSAGTFRDVCIDCRAAVERVALPYPPSTSLQATQRSIFYQIASDAAAANHSSSTSSSSAMVTDRPAEGLPETKKEENEEEEEEDRNKIWKCPDGALRLVILILSTPAGSLRRNAIRGTWMHDVPSEPVKLYLKFVIGTKDLTQEQMDQLSQESEMFQDLLFLSDHKEAYSNLTAKVLNSIAWAHKNLDFDFLVKADDDSYIRLPALETALRELRCPHDLYWGYFTGCSVPETAGRWSEKHWTICPHYLPYAMGGGYVLGPSVVKLIGRFHRHFKLYSNEDVSLGSWLAPFRVTYRHDLRFNTEATTHGCNNRYIISHKEKVRGIYEKYVHLTKNGTLCKEEKEIRPAYVYNWSAPSPLECCERTRGIPISL